MVKVCDLVIFTYRKHLYGLKVRCNLYNAAERWFFSAIAALNDIHEHFDFGTERFATDPTLPATSVILQSFADGAFSCDGRPSFGSYA